MRLLRQTALMASAMAFFATAQTGAQPADSGESATVRALLACQSIEDNADRAACLDRQVAELDAELQSGRLVIVERAAIQSAQREAFGLDLQSVSGLGALFAAFRPSEGEDVSEQLDDGSRVIYSAEGDIRSLLNAPVANVTQNRVGKLVITLENGQVWRQTDSVQIPIVRNSRRDGLSADIEPGALGSHFMTLSHHPRRFRTQRVR